MVNSIGGRAGGDTSVELKDVYIRVPVAIHELVREYASRQVLSISLAYRLLIQDSPPIARRIRELYNSDTNDGKENPP